MEYSWKSGYHGSTGAAQIFGEICERLAKKGNLTAKAVVEEARPTDSPIHGMFEWNDAVAAEKYREVQAGYHIRHLEARPVGGEKSYKAYVSIQPADATHGPGSRGASYMSTTEALANEDTREYVLKAAKLELVAFREKYRQLEELAGVIAAIDAVA